MDETSQAAPGPIRRNSNLVAEVTGAGLAPVVLGGVLSQLLGSRASVAECWGRVGRYDVRAEEEALVDRASAKRRCEFLGGRTLARHALAAYGGGAAPLLSRPDRAPDWPSDMIGSITHTEGYCAAAVAAGRHALALGIDAERVGAVTADLWRLILTPDERRLVEAAAPTDRDKLASLVFSAKEAFFKCQHPLTGAWLDFGDVEVTWTHTALHASTRAKACAGRFASLAGHWRCERNIMITAFLLAP